MKSKSSIIFNSLKIVLSSLVYVFLAQPFFNFSANLTYSSVKDSKTGYELIKEMFEGGSGNAASTILVISLFIISIIAGIIIICSLLNILKALNIIKVNEKLNKVVNLTNLVSVAIVFALSLVAIICTACYLNSGLDMSIAENAVEAFAASGMSFTAEFIRDTLLKNLESSIAYGNIIMLVVSTIMLGCSVGNFIVDKKMKN